MSARILIVEDDSSLREALKDTLELVGHTTFSADNGNAAMHILDNESIDMIVSDVEMSEVDGMQLLQRVSNQYPDLPFILMTAYGSIQQAVLAIQAGAKDYLVKPFEPEVLVTKVSQYLPSAIKEDDDMIAVDELTLEVLALAKKVAQSEATVLVTGESGTGKEVIVQQIHRCCCALPTRDPCGCGMLRPALYGLACRCSFVSPIKKFDGESLGLGVR